MSYLILARNNNDRTAERIASFVDRDYLNSVKADCRAEHLDNVGLTARWMTWSAQTKDEAEKLAEECRSAPNNFTVVHIIPDTSGESLTASRLSELILTLSIAREDCHGET